MFKNIAIACNPLCLNRESFFKQDDVRETEFLSEDNVFSFAWRLKRGSATVARASSRVGNEKWRGVRKDGKIFLQLESSVNPYKTITQGEMVRFGSNTVYLK